MKELFISKNMDLWKNSLATGGCCCWLSWSNGCWEWRPMGKADRNQSKWRAYHRESSMLLTDRVGPRNKELPTIHGRIEDLDGRLNQNPAFRGHSSKMGHNQWGVVGQVLQSCKIFVYKGMILVDTTSKSCTYVLVGNYCVAILRIVSPW